MNCYTYIKSLNLIGVIAKGERGFYRTDILECNNIKTSDEAIAFVDELNENLGITKGTAKAMEFGSMFGWDVPAADPDNWNVDGTLKR